MGKFLFVLVAFVGSLVAACHMDPEQPMTASSALSREGQGAQPNILFIMVDDMGFGDLSYNGSEIRTPTLDRLAASGARLDRYYTYSICSPTRAALMTGYTAFETGVDGPISLDAGLPMRFKLLPQYLKDKGYQTALVGKWHLGSSSIRFFPQSRGFDSFYGILHGFTDHYTHLTPRGELDWQRDGKSVREEGYSTDLFTDEAIRVIEQRDASRPLFLFLSYTAPHTPLQAPDEIVATYSDIKDPIRREYAAMVEVMDSGVGKVVDALDREGMIEKTIIIWVSDNGGNVAAGASNGKLRAGKSSAFEGGVRVPAFVNWPGTIEPSVIEQPVSVHDWMPTLTKLAGLGVPDPEWYGRDLYAVLTKGEEATHPIIVGAKRPGHPRNVAILDWPWKIVRSGSADGHSIDALFNIKTDPEERTNLAQKQPAILARLQSALASAPIVASLAEKEDQGAISSKDPSAFLKGFDTEKLPPVAESASAD